MNRKLKTCHPATDGWQVSYNDKIPVLLPFGKTIFQFKKNQSVTSDTEFLVGKILEKNSRKNLKVLELGSGNGIISIMLAHDRPGWKISGIELQEKLVHQARENAQLAGVQIKFLNEDLKNEIFPPQSFDLLISNPPYFPKNEGKISPYNEKAISTHEILCSMEDVFRSIKYNLKKEGKAYLIYPLSRMKNIEKNIKKVDLKVGQKFILNTLRNKEKIVVEVTLTTHPRSLS